MAPITSKKTDLDGPAKHTDRFRQIDQTMKFGKVDEIIYNRSKDEAPIVDKQIVDMAPQARMSKSGALGWHFDTFQALVKNVPSISGYGDPMVKELVKRLRDSEKYAELRSYTVAEEVPALLGATTLTVELAAKLPEEFKKKAEEARKAKEEAEAAAQRAKQAKDDPNATEEQKLDAEEAAQDAAAASQAAQVRLAATIRNQGRAIAQACKSATEKAADETGAVSAACKSFGTGVGEVGGGLPPAEKFKLAEMVKRSGPAFKQLCKLLGRLTAEAVQKQASKNKHEAGAIADVTLGSDIPNILDDELVQLVVPGLKRAMMGLIADDRAMMYEVENKEPQAKGDMVVLIDESGSMSGQPEAEAKGVALALAAICMQQSRRFVAHFFQSDVTFTVELLPGDKAKKAPDGSNLAMYKFMQIALRGTAGGTDFDRPLARAIETVRKGGLDKADILAITDGCCDVSEKTIKDVEALKGETGARVFTMMIGGGDTTTVKKFSEKVWSCTSLLNGAASELFECI